MFSKYSFPQKLYFQKIKLGAKKTEDTDKSRSATKNFSGQRRFLGIGAF